MPKETERLIVPTDRIFWNFKLVDQAGFVPVSTGPGTQDYMNETFHDHRQKVVYIAYSGPSDKPGECLYVGMGKPERPLWRYSGSGRTKCEMLMLRDPASEFTIEVIAISDDWVLVSVLENFLCVTLHPALNKIRNPRLSYALIDYRECEKLWDSSYKARFGHLAK